MSMSYNQSMAYGRSTRALTRALATGASPNLTSTPGGSGAAPASRKRKKGASDESPSQTTGPKAKKAAVEPTSSTPPNDAMEETPANPTGSPSPVPAQLVLPTEEDIIPPILTFSIEDAKSHLIKADARFGKLFAKLACKPFEKVEAIEPFRTLATSILGQQISWKAAHSIKHKFIRLFDTTGTIPEQPPAHHEKDIEFFPSAHAVAASNIATLRTAGLSARKAEYILDLASRFADGRLSAKKLHEGTDEQVYEMLIQVKGIGPWTVEMFSIFSLRRPNILPVGDLGVQKGVLRWILASHSDEEAKKIKIAPHRLPGNTEGEAETAPAPVTADEGASSSVIPAAETPANPPATPVKKKGKKGAADSGKVPQTPFTKSVFAGTAEDPIEPLPLPDGLSVATMKSRLSGKKTKKGAYLSPEEMEALTEPWAPYRSIGVWFMWSIVDVDTT